jgi:Predicted transcriptional regulators
MEYSIAKASEKTGLTPHTLRFYDKEGLLPFVARTASGIRIFQDSDIEWLSLITCLKNTGMSIKDIKVFIDWYQEGDATLEKRLMLFRHQKEIIEEQMKALNQYMEKINYKIKYYETAVAAGTEAIQEKCCKE